MSHPYPPPSPPSLLMQWRVALPLLLSLSLGYETPWETASLSLWTLAGCYDAHYLYCTDTLSVSSLQCCYVLLCDWFYILGVVTS